MLISGLHVQERWLLDDASPVSGSWHGRALSEHDSG